MEHPESTQNNSVLKAALILAIALAVLFGFLYFNARQENNQLNVDVTEKERTLLVTQSKLDSISRELDAKIAEVTALGGQVDELEALKEQLEQDKQNLMNSKNVSIRDYNNKIKNYEAILAKKDEEIARLRSENTELNQENLTLNSEVTNLQTEKTTLQTQKSALESEKTALADSVVTYSQRNRELSEKVTMAAALKAMNITVNSINARGRERDGGDYKARRIDKIKVSFKLAENPLTKKENKTIYMRLTDGNGNVISDMATGSGKFSFGGKQTVYTAKQSIFYDNTGQTVDFIYSRGAPYESGTYTVELFSEDFRIGQTNFTVK